MVRSCVNCRYFEALYSPIRVGGECFERGRADCIKHDETREYLNLCEFKKFTCKDYEEKEKGKER